MGGGGVSMSPGGEGGAGCIHAVLPLDAGDCWILLLLMLGFVAAKKKRTFVGERVEI